MKSASRLKPVRNPRLSPVALMLTAIAILASRSSVFATDYRVEFGVDSRAGKDAGTLECVLDEICTLQLEPFGLAVYVSVSSRDPDRASVRLFGNEGCCYFNGAASSTLVNLRDMLSRLPIFLRDRARGDLFIENERPVGTLYLRFQRR